MEQKLRITVIGAGKPGSFSSEILMGEFAQNGREVSLQS